MAYVFKENESTWLTIFGCMLFSWPLILFVMALAYLQFSTFESDDQRLLMVIGGPIIYPLTI